MQRYKALLEKTKTLFWNRWFTTNRRVVSFLIMERCVDVYGMRVWRVVSALTKDMGGCAPDPR